MSSPLGQPSQSGGFRLPAHATRAGGDPDGVVDNRPGIAHPSMTRHRAKSVREAQHALRDHYARSSNSSSDRINQTSETTRDADRPKELMVGVSLRTPKPLRKVKSKGRRGQANQSHDDWDSEWSWTSDDSIEQSVDPDTPKR